MSLEEQIELFTQNLVTKNNLPSWFHRTIKDLISKNVTIEEWNTFTQYISNNTSDIKSIEEFVLILADYIEGYCSKDYVDEQDAATLESAKSYADEKFETKDDAFSGNYNDLDNKPSIPTKTSDLQNDSGYITIADVPDTYTKTEIDNKDANTLSSAKSYTDSKIPSALVYEYELIFDDADNEDTWFYRFISTNGGLINTSVPETYAELVQFIKDYGILYANAYRMIGYAYDNGVVYYSHIYFNPLTNYLKVTFPGRPDQTIDASNLVTNSITLKKRTC